MAFNLCYTLAIDERDGEMESKIIKSVFIFFVKMTITEKLYIKEYSILKKEQEV